MASKYYRFIDFLDGQDSDTVTCSFEQIENIIGERLPSSASSYDAWWSNHPSHPLMRLVLDSGWTKTSLDLDNRQVTFSRNAESKFSYDDLKNFLTKEMILFRNYQPVIIKTLLVSPDFRIPYDVIVKKLEQANNFEKKDYRLIAYDVQREVLDKFGRRRLVLKDDRTKDFMLNIDRDITEEQRRDLINICDEKIGEISGKRNAEYYIALGPWSNWDHTLNHPPLRWGVRDSSASNVGVYEALREGDIVFYYANQDPPTPFSKRGFFGVGKVTRKYVEANEKYWPDEVMQNKVMYKHRFELETLKMVNSDEELLPWVNGLPFTKGLNHIVDQVPLEKLLEHADKKWDLDLPFFTKTGSANSEQGKSVNYLMIRHNPDYKRNKSDREYWDDVLGKEYNFGKTVPNYTKVTPGSKTVWFYTDNDDIYLWGYGDVSALRVENDKYNASFDNFTRLGERPPKLDESVQKKIKSLPSWNRFNSIIEINKEIYDEIASPKAVMEETFPNTTLPLPNPNSLAVAKDKIKQELLIDDKTIEQIIGSLYSGKNVLLTGPVGTGKTHLAQLLPKYVWGESGGYYPETVTATSDWTTQDVIGGIFPKIKQGEVSYLVQKGCVSDTVSRNWKDGDSSANQRINPIIEGRKYRGIWLVIDEFNRANIDRAFGQLFTALEYKKLKIPTTDHDKTFEEIVIPEDYRIIGTLNTFDKHFLFRISDALKRRFSFIEILPPTYDKKESEIRFVAEKAISGLADLQKELNISSYGEMQKDQNLIVTLDNLYEMMAFVRLSKNLGTALMISMFREVLINFFMNRDWEKSLDNAMTTILLPQLESLQYWQIDSIMNFVSGRIPELFRRFDVNRRPDIDRYEEELKNLTRYLSFSGKNKNAPNWNNKFRTGEIMKEPSLISDLDPWHNRKRPNLRTFREGLEAIKKEKGLFEENSEPTENAI